MHLVARFGWFSKPVMKKKKKKAKIIGTTIIIEDEILRAKTCMVGVCQCTYVPLSMRFRK